MRRNLANLMDELVFTNGEIDEAGLVHAREYAESGLLKFQELDTALGNLQLALPYE